jgi:hypothetical protein
LERQKGLLFVLQEPHAFFGTLASRSPPWRSGFFIAKLSMTTAAQCGQAGDPFCND